MKPFDKLRTSFSTKIAKQIATQFSHKLNNRSNSFQTLRQRNLPCCLTQKHIYHHSLFSDLSLKCLKTRQQVQLVLIIDTIQKRKMITNKYFAPISYRLERNLQPYQPHINEPPQIDKSEYLVLPGRSACIGLQGNFEHLSLWIGTLEKCQSMLIHRHKREKGQQLYLVVDKDGMVQLRQNLKQEIIVTVKNFCGRKILIKTKRQNTIDSLKAAITEKEGWPKDNFCLIKRGNGKILNKAYMIEDCGLQNNQQVEMMLIFNPSMNG